MPFPLSLFLWIAGAAGLLALLILLPAYVAFRIAFLRAKRQIAPESVADREGCENHREFILSSVRAVLDEQGEDVEITADDGIRLHAKWIEGDPDKPIYLMAHGYRSHPAVDFLGGVPEAKKDGFSVLLIDQRAHGKSEGKSICFGIRERYDVLRWAEYLRDRFGKERKIFLFGVSMGAATVLLASELPLPENVVGVIADCPYSSVSEILLNTARGMGIPAFAARPMLSVGAKLFAGFDPAAASPEDAVRKSKLPILLIHGEADGFVPCDMSRKIAAARPEGTTFLTFPGANHGMSYLTDRPRYLSAYHTFVNNVLNQTKGLPHEDS